MIEVHSLGDRGPADMEDRRFWFLAGLGLTTLSTLLLEILNTRLLSVLTWYHLSFFAVSTAMFGMAAGAVRVYLGGARFEGAGARRALVRYAIVLALSIPLSHAANLYIPIPGAIGWSTAGALGLTTVVLAVPFYVSGVVVAVSLTRIPGPSGLIYAVDLVGAALGCLLIVPLLDTTDISSVALLCGAVAGVAALCFQRFAGRGRALVPAAVAALLALATLTNATSGDLLRLVYSKGRPVSRQATVSESWTIHGYVNVRRPERSRPFFWGPGRGAYRYWVNRAVMTIDGEAATVMTRWDGSSRSLAWVQHDVTSLPYHLRQGGDAAVIGVGGGRDLLTALWARCRSVTGVEVNQAFIELLNGRFQRYANLSGRPEVQLVHDEARSYLTRTPDRYDVLQMSLIDTWAATGAGAFTLSENGLYTREAWRVFLGVLKPRGLLSVSRWYSPSHASETSRLLALAVASLLDRGVERPSAHLALVASAGGDGAGGVATLLVSNEPLAEEDLARLREVSTRFGFRVLMAPDAGRADGLLARIARSDSQAALAQALADEAYDYGPPTDERPYFFNVLRPRALLRVGVSLQGAGVVADGNLLATVSLGLLWIISAVLVGVVIIAPLAWSGLPRMERSSFAQAVTYFALIGACYMLVQIPLIQRFSVYLGHPTYAVSVILFSMILFTGIGSLLSDRIPVEREPRWLTAMSVGIALVLLGATFGLQPLVDGTIERRLLARCALAAGLVAGVALPLGLCFPIGLRIVRGVSPDALPWMWGVNGALSVLASVSAVAVSMWSGIHTNLYVAAAGYAIAGIPLTALWRRGRGERAD